MSPKYEKPLIVPFNYEDEETGFGISCSPGAQVTSKCQSGTVAGRFCKVGSTAVGNCNQGSGPNAS